MTPLVHPPLVHPPLAHAPLALDDAPRWVEAHGVAADPAHWRAAVGGRLALGHDAAHLIVVTDVNTDVNTSDNTVDIAALAALAALAAAHPSHALLVEATRDDLARASGRLYERAILHALPDPDVLPDATGAVALAEIPADLPAPLAHELQWALARGPVWSAWLDGAPVSFAYAPWRSARWFDVSVDTLPSARQLGLGAIVAAAMIRDESARGREPVWGANESNAASLALARRLGFAPIDAIYVCAPAT